MSAFGLPQGTAYIVITAVTGTIYTLLVWCIRLFIRLKINKPFAWDDIHCAIATAFTVLHACLTLSQTDYGLGHPTYLVSAHATSTRRVLGWIGVLCFLQASCFSMLSITFLILRVTKQTSHARPAHLLALATALWDLTATTIILFQCRLPQPWKTRPHSRCIDIYAAWVFITISRALLEAANVVLAARLVWKLRMPLAPKLAIVAMFATRLLVIPPTVIRLHYLEISWQAADWSYARINVQILTQVAMHVSTILATVPCVKNFLLVFESGNLHPPTTTGTQTQTQTQTHATTLEGSMRRVSNRASSSIYARRAGAGAGTTDGSTVTATRRPALETSRRAKSELDVRHRPTAIRPGPVHTLRMNSWSAPGLNSPSTTTSAGFGMGTGLQTISTAEHDPEDAKNASLERRKSIESDDSRRSIKRTQSISVDWREREGRRERSGRSETLALALATGQRRGSRGSVLSSGEEEGVKEDGEV